MQRRKETAVDLLRRRKSTPVLLGASASSRTLRGGQIAVAAGPTRQSRLSCALWVAARHVLQGGTVAWISVLEHVDRDAIEQALQMHSTSSFDGPALLQRWSVCWLDNIEEVGDAVRAANTSIESTTAASNIAASNLVTPLIVIDGLGPSLDHSASVITSFDTVCALESACPDSALLITWAVWPWQLSNFANDRPWFTTPGKFVSIVAKPATVGSTGCEACLDSVAHIHTQDIAVTIEGQPVASLKPVF
jgi:hypothetical protein